MFIILFSLTVRTKSKGFVLDAMFVVIDREMATLGVSSGGGWWRYGVKLKLK